MGTSTEKAGHACRESMDGNQKGQGVGGDWEKEQGMGGRARHTCQVFVLTVRNVLVCLRVAVLFSESCIWEVEAGPSSSRGRKCR